MTIDDYKNSDKNLIIMDNKIYNMEYFIDIHPGGKNFIKSIIRKDPNYIKQIFVSGPNNHTQNAKKILELLHIGELID